MARPTDDARAVSEAKACVKSQLPTVNIIDRIIKEIDGKAGNK